MTTFKLCYAPVPLAGYLKALGVFRLVAEQVDEDARGYWCDERFVLQTRLTEEELVSFFVGEYKPTPVVAPWNSGNFFWKNKGVIDPLKESGEDSDSRLEAYQEAIGICKDLIREYDFSEAPTKKKKKKEKKIKDSFIISLRASLSEKACRWLDGALALTTNGPCCPPILGTGGNDSNLDFSQNFRDWTLYIIKKTKQAKSEKFLRSSLFSETCAILKKGPVGQFCPGKAGGANAGTGFKEKSRVNPWDFILTIEGALVFASAAVRRHSRDRVTALAFPFTTKLVGTGSGAADFSDEKNAHCEFWAPLWSRAAGFGEILMLMSEGRAVLDGGSASDGLDFARAASQLGFARGIDSFHRYAFLERNGQSYFAIPLSRVRVRENPRVSLISELDDKRWLSLVREKMRAENVPVSFVAIGRKLNEALFRLARDSSTETVQGVLIVVGLLVLEMGRRPVLRKSLFPPPLLSEAWAAAADDGSPEFALAEALASLDSKAGNLQLRFRHHLAPLSQSKNRVWDNASKVLAVWTGRDLIRDMSAVLERRLIEAQRGNFTNKEFAELPLNGWRPAPLGAVAAFLVGRTYDEKIATLAAGLAWTKSRKGAPSGVERNDALPFAYAVLKPLFAPDGVGADENTKHLLDPLPLVRLLRVGRAKDAIKLAQRKARGAGLPAPFAKYDSTPPLDLARRITAALLFPIAQKARSRLIARAYPNLSINEETPYAA